jgi:hypothetical protein
VKDDGRPDTGGGRVEARIFLAVATFHVVATVVYGITSRERAGTAMLFLTAGMGIYIGIYLTLQARRHTDAAVPGRPGGHGEIEAAEGGLYLPHASIWPFGMGVGFVVLANGLALGLWAVGPGLVISGASIYGFARQSRRRD